MECLQCARHCSEFAFFPPFSSHCPLSVGDFQPGALLPSGLTAGKVRGIFGCCNGGRKCYWRRVGGHQGCHSIAYDTQDSLPLPHEELFSAECQQCPDRETLIRMRWNKIEQKLSEDITHSKDKHHFMKRYFLLSPNQKVLINRVPRATELHETTEPLTSRRSPPETMKRKQMN